MFNRMQPSWSEWRRFPDPRRCGVLVAPLGPGCYELRNGRQLVLYGKGSHVAERMTSLLPKPWGCGTRNNRAKREYVLAHLRTIEYRTLPCNTHEAAKEEERNLQLRRSKYLFES